MLKVTWAKKGTVKAIKYAIGAFSILLPLILNSSLHKEKISQQCGILQGQHLSNQVKRTEVSNYPSISVLSVFLRLLENIVLDQVYNFIKKHRTTPANHFAFRKMHTVVP